MRSHRLVLALLAATVSVVGVIWGTDLPLGVPGQWTWSRLPSPTSPVLTYGVLAVGAAGFVGFVRLGVRRIERNRPVERAAWLIGLFAAGFAWLWIAQEAAPGGHQLSKAAWVLYFRGPSGYFAEARSDPRPLAGMLADYEAQMRRGDVLHMGTHPPGLIVFFRGLIALCDSSPGAAAAILATEPDSVRDSFAAIRHTNADRTLPITATDEAVLWLAALLAQTAAAATVFPLYGLLRLNRGPRASWLAAAFWPAVPAIAVFLPKSDAAFPCITALVLWLWLGGLARGSSWRAALAGFVFWLGLFLSLAFLPVGLIAAIVTVWPLLRKIPEGQVNPSLRSLVRPLAWAAAGFLTPCLLLRLSSRLDLATVWWLNLRNHAGFYGEYPRTFWKWLLVNPLEFAIAAGVPLACLALCGAVRRFRTGRSVESAPAIAFAFTWGTLWLSGKNMGEAARLWIFLTPCLIWIAAPLLEGQADNGIGETSPKLSLRTCCTCLALQLICCAAIVTRVAGFDFQ